MLCLWQEQVLNAFKFFTLVYLNFAFSLPLSGVTIEILSQMGTICKTINQSIDHSVKLTDSSSFSSLSNEASTASKNSSSLIAQCGPS